MVDLGGEVRGDRDHHLVGGAVVRLRGADRGAPQLGVVVGQVAVQRGVERHLGGGRRLGAPVVHAQAEVQLLALLDDLGAGVAHPGDQVRQILGHGIVGEVGLEPRQPLRVEPRRDVVEPGPVRRVHGDEVGVLAGLEVQPGAAGAGRGVELVAEQPLVGVDHHVPGVELGVGVPDRGRGVVVAVEQHSDVLVGVVVGLVAQVPGVLPDVPVEGHQRHVVEPGLVPHPALQDVDPVDRGDAERHRAVVVARRGGHLRDPAALLGLVHAVAGGEHVVRADQRARAAERAAALPEAERQPARGGVGEQRRVVDLDLVVLAEVALGAAVAAPPQGDPVEGPGRRGRQELAGAQVPGHPALLGRGERGQRGQQGEGRDQRSAWQIRFLPERLAS